MPLRGKGMLITSMDVDPAEEDDFNLWYDREHLAERVAIEGFIEARRWIAEEAPTKYFCTYSTETFEVLNSPAYQKVLANQTDWSKHHISRFRNPGRVVGRITVSRGQGRGGVLGVVRLRPNPSDDQSALREKLGELLDPGMLLGIISVADLDGEAELGRGDLDRHLPTALGSREIGPLRRWWLSAPMGSSVLKRRSNREPRS